MGNTDINKSLRRAASKGRVEEIKRLLDLGADIETRGGFFSMGHTPLICAIWAGEKEAVKYLLERGASPEAKDDAGDTPLWTAVERDNKDIVEILLAHGADPRNRCDMMERHSPTAMARANKNSEIATMLSLAILERHRSDRIAALDAERRRAEEEARAKEAERCKNKDIVIVFSPLGDRTLQEVYNFAALERISLVRKAEDGPVEAITRQDFADVGDKPGLRQAFAEHLRRGGTAPEKAVFPGTLQKLKPLPKDTP